MRAIPLILLPFLLFSPTGTWAQEPACPEGNLLRGKQPSRAEGILRPTILTDDAQPHEGGLWDTQFTGILANEASFVEYDLGQSTRIDALHIQTDNNDTLEVYASEDGTTFRYLLAVPTVNGQGMRSRSLDGIGVTTRSLRIGRAKGDGAYSIGEIQAFCQTPDRWPPDIPLVGDPPLATTSVPQSKLERWWSDREQRLSVHKSIIGVFGLLVFVGLMWEPLAKHKLGQYVSPAAAAAALLYTAVQTWRGWSLLLFLLLCGLGLVWAAVDRNRGRARQRRYEQASLVALLFVGALCWSNFWTFHDGRVVHLWEQLHYYVGSKYFIENDYRWLYHCGLAAEVDDGRREEVMSRKYRDLNNNRLGRANLIADEADRVCRENFGERRWQAFRQDIRLFRTLMGAQWFREFFEDHGYNATPAWNMFGAVISNWGWEKAIPPPELVNSPVNRSGKTASQLMDIDSRFETDSQRLYRKLEMLATIDGVLYAGAFVLILWAFGLRAAALACIMWGVGHPWAYYWTGGSFGRASWFFMAVAGLCFLKRGNDALGGGGLAWALHLRVFPGALAGGVGLKIAWNAITERRIERAHLQFLVGAVVTFVLLVGLSLPAAGGFDAYTGFISNSFKHKATPLTNHMGLPTLVSYDPRFTAARMGNVKEDPFGDWKDKRRELLKDRKLTYIGLLLGLVALLGYTVRKMRDWEATALSTSLIFGIFELTCYYFSYMVLLAPFCLRRTKYVVALMATTIATQLANIYFRWTDELNIFDSAIVMALLLFVIGSEAWRQWMHHDALVPTDDGLASVAEQPQPTSSTGKPRGTQRKKLTRKQRKGQPTKKP